MHRIVFNIIIGTCSCQISLAGHACSRKHFCEWAWPARLLSDIIFKSNLSSGKVYMYNYDTTIPFSSRVLAQIVRVIYIYM